MGVAILPSVYILYVDESGNESNPDDRHFVLAGLAVFERQAFYLASALERLQTDHLAGYEPIPFHVSAMRARRGVWRSIPSTARDAVLAGVAERIARVRKPGLVLLAAVIEKGESLHGEDAVRRATEELCRRFDIFLMRRKQEANDPQRGLIVFAEGRFDQRAKVWVKGFRTLGTTWGVLRNLSDIPYFAPMQETRLLQAADYVSHAVFTLYEDRDACLVKPILHRFCEEGGTLHGLVHVRPSRRRCDCPACESRRTPWSFGPWV